MPPQCFNFVLSRGFFLYFPKTFCDFVCILAVVFILSPVHRLVIVSKDSAIMLDGHLAPDSKVN